MKADQKDQEVSNTSQQPDVFGQLQKILATPPKYPFNAILLATDEDQAVTTYMNQYTASLGMLTGNACNLLYFKAPAPVITAKVVSPVPTPPGAAYALADKMNIPSEKMPCILVFERLSDDLSTVAIVGIPKDSITTSFRQAVDDMRTCKDHPDGERVKCFKGKRRNRFIITTAKGILAEVIKDGLSSAIGAVVKAIP